MQSDATPELAIAAGIFLLLIGIGLGTWGMRLILRQRRSNREHARATGTVVEITLVEGMDNSTFYFPIVTFTTASHQQVRVQCFGSTQLQYPVGASVPILYNPDRPDEAEIAGGGTVGIVLLMTLALFPIALGLVFLVLGLFGKWSGGFRPLEP